MLLLSLEEVAGIVTSAINRRRWRVRSDTSLSGRGHYLGCVLCSLVLFGRNNS